MVFTLRNIDYGANRNYESRVVSIGRRDLVDNLGIPMDEIVKDPVLVDRVLHLPRDYFKIVRRGPGNYDLIDYSGGNVCLNATQVVGAVAKLRSMDVIRCGPRCANNPLSPNDPKGPFSFYFLVNGDSQKTNEELEAANWDIHVLPTTQHFFQPATQYCESQSSN